MPWQREAEFKEVLEKAVKKGSKGAIATTQAIALQDMAQCYKHVCALVERQMRKAKPAQRLNALYIISTICRHSLKKNKLQDKYTVRWGPNIANLVELLADLPNQAAQVEKVLASWKKETIFSDAIVDQCAISAGLELPTAPAAVPAADAADVIQTGMPSPVLTIFSEPSAGSVDLDALDSFPPKTVASANTEAVRATEATSIPPANNASTGSSRPPIEAPSDPAPPAELYDPFAADSYDYDPFGSSPPPAPTPLTLPPLPSLTPAVHATHASITSFSAGDANSQPGRQSSSSKAADVTALGNGGRPEGSGKFGGNILAPSVIKAAELATAPPSAPPQPTSAGRKRKSRWEDASPATQPVAAAASQPAASPAVAAAAPLPPPPSSSAPAAAASAPLPAEGRSKRRSRFSDAPPHLQPALATGQGSLSGTQEPPGASQAAAFRQITLQQPLPGAEQTPQRLSHPQIERNRSPDPPLPPDETTILPPKTVTARQDGEAQAAAALEAVEQMLQAKRHSEARNIPPASSRPRQPPPPPPQQHQPPLPQPLPPQPPLPQQPPPQPTFTEEPHDSAAPAAPAWHAQHAGHAAHAGHAVPSFGARPPVGLPTQQPFPHIAQQLQQGLQQGLHSPPHLGHLNPQHFVQAGLQQHHRPAPPHHLPSMLHQPLPPLQGMQQSSAPPPPYALSPQTKSPMPRQQSLGQGPLPSPAPPARPPAPPAFKPQSSPSADLGHFQTTSVTMDTPTDTASIPAWQMRRSQPSSASKVVKSPDTDGQTPAPPAGSPDAPPPPPSLSAITPAEETGVPLQMQTEPAANPLASKGIKTVAAGQAPAPPAGSPGAPPPPPSRSNITATDANGLPSLTQAEPSASPATDAAVPVSTDGPKANLGAPPPLPPPPTTIPAEEEGLPSQIEAESAADPATNAAATVPNDVNQPSSDGPPPPPSLSTSTPADENVVLSLAQAEPAAYLATTNAAAVSADAGKANMPESGVAAPIIPGASTEETLSKTGSAESAPEEEMDMSE